MKMNKKPETILNTIVSISQVTGNPVEIIFNNSCSIIQKPTGVFNSNCLKIDNGYVEAGNLIECTNTNCKLIAVFNNGLTLKIITKMD